MNMYTEALVRERERKYLQNKPLPEGVYRATIVDLKEKYGVLIGDKRYDQLEIHFYLENGFRIFQRYFPSLKPGSKFYNVVMNLFGEIPSDVEDWRLISKKCRVKVEHTYLSSGKLWNAVTEVLPLMMEPVVQAQQAEDVSPVDECDHINPDHDMIDESQFIHKDESINTYDDNDCWEFHKESDSQSTKNISAKIVNPPPKRVRKIAPRKVE